MEKKQVFRGMLACNDMSRRYAVVSFVHVIATFGAVGRAPAALLSLC